MPKASIRSGKIQLFREEAKVNKVTDILKDILANNLTHDKVKYLLSVTEEKEKKELITKAREIRDEVIGNKVYLRGLIELSNHCSKNCYYCGIRSANDNVERYFIPDDEVLSAAVFALNNRYGSIVIQSGEISSKVFTKRITRLLQDIVQWLQTCFRSAAPFDDFQLQFEYHRGPNVS